MRTTFCSVAKNYRPDDPVIKTIALPNGTQAKIMRRDVHEKALQAANKKLNEILGKDSNAQAAELHL